MISAHPPSSPVPNDQTLHRQGRQHQIFTGPVLKQHTGTLEHFPEAFLGGYGIFGPTPLCEQSAMRSPFLFAAILTRHRGIAIPRAAQDVAARCTVPSITPPISQDVHSLATAWALALTGTAYAASFLDQCVAATCPTLPSATILATDMGTSERIIAHGTLSWPP